MNADRLVGSKIVRGVTAVAALAAASGFALAWSGRARGALTGAVICAVVTFLGGIYCARRGFALWMRFAKIVNRVMTTLVFGLCYLVLVPMFVPFVWIVDPLRLRRGSNCDSFWHERHRPPVNIDMLRRMG